MGLRINLSSDAGVAQLRRGSSGPKYPVDSGNGANAQGPASYRQKGPAIGRALLIRRRLLDAIDDYHCHPCFSGLEHQSQTLHSREYGRHRQVAIGGSRRTERTDRREIDLEILYARSLCRRLSRSCLRLAAGHPQKSAAVLLGRSRYRWQPTALPSRVHGLKEAARAFFVGLKLGQWPIRAENPISRTIRWRRSGS
jgi:hypothetical protein